MLDALIGWHVPEVEPGLAWWPLVAVIAALVLVNVINNRLAPNSHYFLWSIAGSVLFLAIGILDGNSWIDMGLGLAYLLPGLIWAAASIGLVTVAYLIASAFRKTREAFHDERIVEMSGGRLAFQALIEVPFGTVLFEEIAFRAVLFSMLARRFGVVPAIIISALLFGIWHVLPSIGTHEANPALGSVVGTGTRGHVLAVLASVATTTLAGVVFAMMRIVSGSVLAPMGLHWATNGLGYGFSWVLITWRRKRRGSSGTASG